MLPEVPVLPESFVINSTFFTNAPEINSSPFLKSQTFNFRGCDSWYTLGLQVLTAVGWRPECAKADCLNMEKAMPPRPQRHKWIAVGSSEAMEWIEPYLPSPHEDTVRGMDNAKMVDIEVEIHTYKQYKLSCSYCKNTNGQISCQGWVVGYDTEPVASS